MLQHLPIDTESAMPSAARFARPGRHIPWTSIERYTAAARPGITERPVALAPGLREPVEGLFQEDRSRSPWRSCFSFVVAEPVAAAALPDRTAPPGEDAASTTIADDAGGRRQPHEREGSHHHITSISAWRAPADLMACRMEMRSRGPIAERVQPVDEFAQRVTPSRTMASLFPSPVSTFTRGAGHDLRRAVA